MDLSKSANEAFAGKILAGRETVRRNVACFLCRSDSNEALAVVEFSQPQLILMDAVGRTWFYPRISSGNGLRKPIFRIFIMLHNSMHMRLCGYLAITYINNSIFILLYVSMHMRLGGYLLCGWYN